MSNSFSRCERLQDSKLSIAHYVSFAVYPFQDLGLERGCRSGCLGSALSETRIDSASLCEFHWRQKGKSPSHEVRQANVDCPSIPAVGEVQRWDMRAKTLSHNLRNHSIHHGYYAAFSHVAYTQYISLYCTWMHMAQTFDFIY